MNDNTKKNIYHKLQTIQEEIGQLAKTEENKFQKYRYVPEYEILKSLKPLLKKQKLILAFDDVIVINKEENGIVFNENNATNLYFKKEEKEWVVKYLKRAVLINTENPEEKLTYHFWACGQNTDLAKAKGSAETYAIKYFLMKFLLIPTSDNLDPDSNEVEQLYQLYLEKISNDATKQRTFFNSFDSALSRQNIGGQTTADNLKSRINLLKKEDFIRILNFLEKMK